MKLMCGKDQNSVWCGASLVLRLLFFFSSPFVPSATTIFYPSAVLAISLGTYSDNLFIKKISSQF